MSSSIHDKLFRYEVQPPNRVWDEISAAMDSPIHTIGERLHDFEAVPDKKAWGRIEQLLQPTKSGQRIPFYKRYSRPLRYSGVAAAIIFAAITLSLLVSKKTESEVPAPAITSNGSAGIDNNKQQNDQNDDGSRTTVAAITGKESKFSFKRNLFRAASSISINPPPLSEKFLATAAERHAVIAEHLSDDKYMVYSDGNGHAFRLPKKIFDAIACPLDNNSCKQRIKNLQEIMAGAAVTSDFGGILQILEHLQENQ